VRLLFKIARTSTASMMVWSHSSMRTIEPPDLRSCQRAPRRRLVVQGESGKQDWTDNDYGCSQRVRTPDAEQRAVRDRGRARSRAVVHRGEQRHRADQHDRRDDRVRDPWTNAAGVTAGPDAAIWFLREAPMPVACHGRRDNDGSVQVQRLARPRRCEWRTFRNQGQCIASVEHQQR
jgi:hypothetical protein